MTIDEEMYVRFIISDIDRNSGKRQGVFQTAYRLVRQDLLSKQDDAELRAALGWFGKRLSIPDRFSRSSRPEANGRAISWFKDSAAECIKQMRTICELLRQYDVPFEMITSSRPGYIVYEDRDQIAAIPFSDTAS